MSETEAETTYVDNIFGVVTDKRVVYHPNRGWLTEGREEDAPLSHIASVEFVISRSLSNGILLIVIGVPTMLVLVGVILILFGYCLVKGTPTVIVNTTDGKREMMKGWPWHREQAYNFAKALQGRIGPDQEVRLEYVSSVSVGTSRHLLSGPLLFVIVIAALVVVVCAIVWLVMLLGLSPF
ncbi:MAG: hypothetical protein KGJ40_04920 [candidate division NC10 bacterium]|nr:hypothetical protein [candidate division NC10 bacterium]MDE2484747.1 hypothetical protein [candidate division NC10 bacterium]